MRHEIADNRQMKGIHGNDCMQFIGDTKYHKTQLDSWSGCLILKVFDPLIESHLKIINFCC